MSNSHGSIVTSRSSLTSSPKEAQASWSEKILSAKVANSDQTHSTRSLLNTRLKSGNLSVIRRCSVEEARIDAQSEALNQALNTRDITKTRMGAGYNGLELDPRIQQARLDYVMRSGSAGYGPFQGETAARDLAAKHFNARYRKGDLSKLTGRNVVFTIGSQGALTFVKKAVTNQGDAVMSLGKYAYPMYKPNIEKAGGVHMAISPSDPSTPIPSAEDIERAMDKFLTANPGKKVVLIIQTENPLGCSPTEEWAKNVASAMKRIWAKHGENSLFGIGDGIYDGLAQNGEYYDVADYLPNLCNFAKLKSGAKTFGNAGGLRLGAIFTENNELVDLIAEQQFIEVLSASNEGQWALAKVMELETDPKEIAKVSKYFEENTELCRQLGRAMSGRLHLPSGIFGQYDAIEARGMYRKGGFYLWGNLTDAVSGLAIPPEMQKIAGSQTVNCATTFTRLLLNGHLMAGVRKSVVTTPVEDFIVDPNDLIDPKHGAFRIEGRFSTSAKRETFPDSFEAMERMICKLWEYNLAHFPERVPAFAKHPDVLAHIKEVTSKTASIEKQIESNPAIRAMQQKMIEDAEKSMNAMPWKAAPAMLAKANAARAVSAGSTLAAGAA